jgi:hypothetical protein
MDYPQTYYRQSLAETRARPAFRRHETFADHGGGLAGLTTPELARAGQS